MIRRVALALLAVAVSSAAAAEPFSIRCTDGKAPRPYFATFDLETNRLVFESSIRSLHAGEIKGVSDDRIQFSIKADDGRIDLTWDWQHGRMIWAGISADTIRPTLVHRCVTVAARTPLAVYEDPTTNPAASTRPFSLRCVSEHGMPYFFTLDRETKKVVVESPHGGRLTPGEIQNASEHRIEFSLAGRGSPDFEVVWDSLDGTVTLKGLPGDRSRPTKVDQCIEIKARSIVTLYDRL